MIGRGGDYDGIEWSRLLPSEVPISIFHPDFIVSQVFQALGRLLRQVPVNFNRVHLVGQLGQNGCLIARAGPNLQDFLSRLYLKDLGHQGHDIGLRDRLSFSDGQGMIRIGLASQGGINEKMARNPAHDLQDFRVGDIPAFEVTRIPADPDDSRTLAQRFADYLGPRIGAARGGVSCAVAQAPVPLSSSEGYVRVEARFACADGAPDTLRYLAMFDLAPGHTHFARIDAPGVEPLEFLFSADRTQWVLPAEISGEQGPAASSRKSSLAAIVFQFLRHGILHILSGPDHIAFLATVMLAAAGLRGTLIAVTGFTLGHSLTLSLAVLGLAHPDPKLVEALIGLTIAIVAIESVALRTGAGGAIATLTALGIVAVAVGMATAARGSVHGAIAYLGMALFAYCYLTLLVRIGDASERRRGWLVAVVTMIFGMVHGFGFASSLLQTGLAGGALAAPLASFNVGVEIGQLVIVAGLWTLGYGVRRAIARLAPALEPRLFIAAAAGVLCGLGLFWFVTRTFV
jgi:hypothetical protein